MRQNLGTLISNLIINFKICILSNDFDVLAETWLNIDTTDDSIAISGYDVFRAARNSRDEGVLLFFRNIINVSQNIGQPPNLINKFFVDELEETVATCVVLLNLSW